MLDAGFSLIKEHGMIHASVEKITKAAGLGKSTFYNFFPSKEMFVYEIIQYQRDKAKQSFMDALGSRKKITAAEAKLFLKKIIFSEDSIYRYLTSEDQARLKAVLPAEYGINPESENMVMAGLFSHIEGVRKDINFKLAANLIKIMAISMFHQEDLHADALPDTLDRIYDLLFSCIFEEGA
nr:TetR/AcrR family transcriptional regulator [Ruminiclostridium sufflavum]